MSSLSESAEINVLLLSAESSLTAWMLEDIGALPDESGTNLVTLFGHRLRLHPHLPDSQVSEDVNPGMIIGLVRFVDVVSLQTLDDLYRNLPSSKRIPAGFCIYRNENEADFKMSCPYCGQKLWVRDADLDKRGRCPNCKKGFTLPRQEAHVSSILRLPESVPVRRVVHGDPASFSGPLQALLKLRDASGLENLYPELRAVSSNATMNVNLDSGHIPGPH
jgi:predicted RNA-binding Zn-ribbon protein involved in translation (DUF1610 family)